MSQQSQQPGSADGQPECPQQMRRDWRPERKSRVMPGLLLILIGALALVWTQGWIAFGDVWKFFLAGLGLIFLIDAGIRFVQKASGAHGRLIAGIMFICVGAAFIVGIGSWWPVVLVAAGIIVIVTRLVRK